MEKPTWKTSWGWMKNTTDEKEGQDVGSVIGMNGRVLGFKLSLIEKVTQRQAPYRKSWHTVGSVNLLVIGHYTMGFEITPQGSNSIMNAYIDYELPNSVRTRWLGHLLGGMYAKWCVRQMLHDTEAHFRSSGETR
jgi:hypothetical protein